MCPVSNSGLYMSGLWVPGFIPPGGSYKVVPGPMVNGSTRNFLPGYTADSPGSPMSLYIWEVAQGIFRLSLSTIPVQVTAKEFGGNFRDWPSEFSCSYRRPLVWVRCCRAVC